MAQIATAAVAIFEPAAARPARALLDGADIAGLLRRSDRRGALQLAAHLGCMIATGVLVWLALPVWWLLIPAMVLYGFTIVTWFAPMHECVHRTAFATPALNAVVGWVAGVVSFYNSTFYWYFHAWHHRYTQDPARDPELMLPKATSRLAYLLEISGVNFWWRRALDYPRLALGLARGLPFLPETARRRVALSMAAQLLVYLAAVVAIVLGWHALLYFWLLPAVLAQPLLRVLLICEHSGCSLDGNPLGNTRTTLASWPVRLLMWNMPFHAEHHAYPSIPFHQLPAVHRQMRQSLVHLAPGYLAANRAIIAALPR